MSTSVEVVRIKMPELDLINGPPSSYVQLMFDVHCPSHGCRVLLGPRSIRTIENDVDGVSVQWRCHCGATGTERFGRRPARSSCDRLDPAA
jgi:hypothetical protein